MYVSCAECGWDAEVDKRDARDAVEAHQALEHDPEYRRALRLERRMARKGLVV